MKKFDTYMVNKIFTVPYLDRMISEDSIPDSFFECVRRYVKTDDATIGEAISEIYHFMNYEYRNEYYYKNTILNQLLIRKHDLYNTAALTELPIGDSKADFIMINGRGVVYEIKTDLDNLIRLENQIKDYYKVFSYIYVVVGNKQLPHVKEFLKDCNLYSNVPTLVSCPTCGRTQIDFIPMAKEVDEFLQTINSDITVAVMGCAVNGPGEAKEADVGFAGGNGEGLLIKIGEVIRKVPEDQLLDTLRYELEHWGE